MSGDFRLLMLSAMYENGGNLTHRLLDGHPQCWVYPFESQLGTRFVVDRLSSLFPVKYRWPEFLLEATPDEDYASIIDEECKVRARTPHVSKFRHLAFEFSDEARRRAYQREVRVSGRSRAGNVAAFFRATFAAWSNYRRSGREAVYVGYSPIIAVDAEKIFSDLPTAHLLHVVRNPWSAYADTKKRPVPLSLSDYMLGWSLTQRAALLAHQRVPGRVHLVRAEDVMADPLKALGPVCRAVGIERASSLATPSWNGLPLAEVAPWGTIRIPTSAANRATAEELSREERESIAAHAGPYLERFGYERFFSSTLRARRWAQARRAEAVT